MVYLPAHFEEHDLAFMHQMIRDYGLGTIVTLAPDGLTANHIPFVLDAKAGDYGRLLGHVARNNTLWREHREDLETLVVFQVTDAYVTPNWYPSKREHGSVVPTWNYAVVHVYGPLVIHDDPKWIRGQAGMLTKQQEANQATPWKMADAPREYTDHMLEQIVGIEIPITRIIGKTKASQNRTSEDRQGVIDGLTEIREIAMAQIVARELNPT